MSILVTGGAGYIGSHMVLNLCDAGEMPVVVDNLVTGFDWAVDGRAHFARGNAGDIDFVEKTMRDNEVDAVIHFAGSVVVPESVSDPLKYYGNNTCVSRTLMDAAIRAGVRHFIFSSTAAVYGETGLAPVKESDALVPVSPYGRSKLMTEMMLADVAAAHPMTYGVLRYFNVAGADPTGRSGQSTKNATHLIKVASEAAIGKRTGMAIFGDDYPTPDGTCVRDYIHVSDLVAAHALLLDYLRKGGGSVTLNCGYGHGYSVRQVIETVKAETGSDFEVTMAPRRAGDPPAIVAGADRIRSVLGWAPKLNDLGEIVRHAYSWEKHLLTRNRD